MFKKMILNLMVSDIGKTIDYYKNNFWFDIVMWVNKQWNTEVENIVKENLVWAMVRKDSIEIMFQIREAFLE